MDHWQQKRRVAILAETYSGCLETDCDYFTTVIPEQGALASPQLFAYTLSNTFLGEAALRFGLTGCCEVSTAVDRMVWPWWIMPLTCWMAMKLMPLWSVFVIWMIMAYCKLRAVCSWWWITRKVPLQPL